MTTRRWKYLLPCLILAVPAALSAQGPRGGFFPWWDSPMVSGLDLTDAQRTEIRSVIREYRGRMVEVRDAVQKAEGDLDAVFNEDTVDQRRGSEAIDRLTKARGGHDQVGFRDEPANARRADSATVAGTAARQREQGARIENAGRGSGPRVGGHGHRLAKGRLKDASKDAPSRTADSQSQTPPPALSQQ